MSERATRGNVGPALLVGLGVFLLQLPFCRYGVSLLDEGVILQAGADILRGQRPYADIVYPAGPGVLYAAAAAFALGGTSVESVRVLAVLLFALAAAAIYVIARWRATPAGAAAVVVLFLLYRIWAYPAWQFLNYSTLAVTMVLLATAVLGTAFTRPRPFRFVLAGALSAAAFFSKQDSGLVGPAALTAVLLARRVRGERAELVPFLAGGIVVGTVILAALGAMGSLRDLFEQGVVAPLHVWRSFDYPRRPALWPFLAQDPAVRANPFAYLPPLVFDVHWTALSQSGVYRRTALLDVILRTVYHLPWIVVVAAGIAHLARRRRAQAGEATDREALVVLLGAAFVLVFNRPQDWVHLLVLYAPTLVLGAWLAGAVARRWRPAAIVLAVGLAAGAVASARLAGQFLALHATPVHGAGGTLYAAAPQASALQGVLDALAHRTSSTTPLAALPYHALVNFLGRRPAPSRYSWIWPVDTNPEREHEIARGILARPDTAVVYSPTQVPHFPRLRTYAPALFGQLVAHYEVAESFGGGPGAFTFLLLERRRAATGRSLLGPGLAAARVRVERAAGAPMEAPLAVRSDLAAEDVWPFERVLRVTTLPDAAVAVVYPLAAGAARRLTIRYGINPDRWQEVPPPRAHFVIAVRRADGGEQELLARDVEPFTRPADRRWTKAEVPLAPFAAEPIDLVLRVTGPAGAAPRADVAGWADPRLD